LTKRRKTKKQSKHSPGHFRIAASRGRPNPAGKPRQAQEQSHKKEKRAFLAGEKPTMGAKNHASDFTLKNRLWSRVRRLRNLSSGSRYGCCCRAKRNWN
jgi:hypothetical protein